MAKAHRKWWLVVGGLWGTSSGHNPHARGARARRCRAPPRDSPTGHRRLTSWHGNAATCSGADGPGAEGWGVQRAVRGGAGGGDWAGARQTARAQRSRQVPRAVSATQSPGPRAWGRVHNIREGRQGKDATVQGVKGRPQVQRAAGLLHVGRDPALVLSIIIRQDFGCKKDGKNQTGEGALISTSACTTPLPCWVPQRPHAVWVYARRGGVFV